MAVGTRVTNTGTVYWNDPAQQASASVSIDVGGIPGIGFVNGRVWHDADFDRVFDANEIALAGWTVELYFNDSLAHVARTARDGVYRMSGVEPNYATTDLYELRFRRPGAGATTAMLGRAHSDFTNDLQRITDIVVLSGSNLQNLNLPIDPNGIVYDASSRAPIAGATVTLAAESGAALPSACFYDENQQGQVTLADGYYKFDLSFADPACPSGGSLPAAGDSAVRERTCRVCPHIIPPQSAAATAAFVVPSCPASDRRRRAGDGAALRGGALGVPAAGVRRAAHERHELLPAPDVRLEPRAGLEPDLQQPHSARSRSRRVA